MDARFQTLPPQSSAPFSPYAHSNYFHAYQDSRRNPRGDYRTGFDPQNASYLLGGTFNPTATFTAALGDIRPLNAQPTAEWTTFSSRYQPQALSPRGSLTPRSGAAPAPRPGPPAPVTGPAQWDYSTRPHSPKKIGRTACVGDFYPFKHN